MARTREFDTDAVLTAAVSTFRVKGFAGTSIQDLVEATGVGRGSLYGAFGDKEGLYLAALDRYRQDFAQPLLALVDSPREPGELVREVLLGLVDEIVRDGDRKACLIVSAATELVARDARVATRVRETMDALETAFTTLAERFDPPAERPADVARFLLAVVEGLRVAGAIRPDRGHLTGIVDITMRAVR